MSSPLSAPTPNAMERPQWACLLCPPPSSTRTWTKADAGYVTCDLCLDRLRATLHEVTKRYYQLNTRPGANADLESRGAPGFGSRPPASEHIIVMRDRRSKSCEVAYDGTVYEDWQLSEDPENDEEAWSHRLPKGVEGPLERPGKYTKAREVWFAADGRGHQEQERPPRSIHGALDSMCTMVAEDRGMTPTFGTVADLSRWLDRQLDYVTRQDWVVDVSAELHELLAQLKPVTGDKRHKIGKCPNTLTLDDGEATRECGHPLYAPTANAKDETIRCGGCGRTWPPATWARLLDMLESA
jgi:hypothetical protein